MGTVWEINLDEFRQACLTHPKYKALAWVIEQAILSGALLHEQKLPAQRLLADKLSITHGTVTRAYDLLEKKGIVKAKLGAGTYVYLPKAISSDRELSPTIEEYDFASSMQPMLGQQMVVKSALEELTNDLSSVEDVMTYAYQGLKKHKKTFVSWFASKGIHLDSKDICFTHGAQQGIYTCIQILTESNDYVLHEELTYPGFYRAADAHSVKPLSIPLTSDGLNLEVLEQYCQQFRPKLLYITANIQNPTNIQYSSEQLDQLVMLSRKYQFYIIEDDVNYCLPDKWRTPLQQRATDRVFYLSSLSKYVAGGLRVACAIVPKQWQQAFNASIHSQCWMVPTLNVELASRFLTSDNFKHNQALLAEEMRYRQEAFKQLADKYGLESRSGGLNVWLVLPNSMNVNQFNLFLASKNIKVRPAELFFYPGSTNCYSNGLRISLGGFNARIDFDRGIAEFDNAVRQFTNQQDIVI